MTHNGSRVAPHPEADCCSTSPPLSSSRRGRLGEDLGDALGDVFGDGLGDGHAPALGVGCLDRLGDWRIPVAGALKKAALRSSSQNDSSLSLGFKLLVEALTSPCTDDSFLVVLGAS